MTSEDVIPAVSDTMFRIIFGSCNKKDNLCYFLSLFLKRDVNEIKENIIIEDKTLVNDKVAEAERRVDIIVKLDGKYYNIELNNNVSKGALKRNIDYASRIFSNKRVKGTGYIYDTVIQINLNNFYFEGCNLDEIEHEFSYYSKNHKYQLTDMLTFNFFYLPLIRRKWYNKLKLSELEKLLLVLTSEKKGDYPELLEGNPMLKKISEEIEYATETDEVLGEYDKEYFDACKLQWAIDDATEKAIEKGMEKGLKAGEENSKRQIAKSMLKDNLPLEKISEYTGLSIDEIKKSSI